MSADERTPHKRIDDLHERIVKVEARQDVAEARQTMIEDKVVTHMKEEELRFKTIETQLEKKATGESVDHLDDKVDTLVVTLNYFTDTMAVPTQNTLFIERAKGIAVGAATTAIALWGLFTWVFPLISGAVT